MRFLIQVARELDISLMGKKDPQLEQEILDEIKSLKAQLEESKYSDPQEV